MSFAEPDGKEVEDAPSRGAEAEERGTHKPPPSSCDRKCSCLCHLRRPGMKLIWVPAGGDTQVEVDGKEEEEEWEEYEEVEVVVGGREDEQTPPRDDGKMPKQSRTKFQQSLDILISESQRRRSDPGPHSVPSLASTQSPRIPPKQPHPVHPSASEEESIYEATLPVVEPPPRKSETACGELDIPLIKVLKSARRSRLSYSTSDPTSEFQAHQEAGASAEGAPPAVPPRVPLTPAHRVGVPLPQPTLEEWRTLRPSSPSGLSTQRAATPPPIIPLRPPPLPPPNHRRLSSASHQPLPEKGPFQNTLSPAAIQSGPLNPDISFHLEEKELGEETEAEG